MTRLARGFLALLLACPLGISAQSRLPPVDQAASVPDFLRFRAQLLDAVARRDVAAVLAVLGKDVKLSFGGDAGVEDFKKMWTPAAPDSALWQVLAATLALGGTFDQEGDFNAPYVYSRWPRDTDTFDHVAAIGSGIRVRSAPDLGASIVGRLDFSIVALADPASVDSRWVKVRLDSNRVGYVDARLVRSPVDHRIRFAKHDGRWQIESFLSGD